MQHLEISDLEARYGALPVLSDFNLTLDRGGIVGLIGPSGSGKSTVLRVLMGLLLPTKGNVRLDGREVNYKDAKALRRLRNEIAIVFQQYNLFQNMTALQNVTITPVKIRGENRKTAEERAVALLTKVGLGDKLKSYPDELSGGQQQRVAIARALALNPQILLLDEVTAALDPELVSEVLETIRNLAEEGMTMMIVSHEMSFIREICSKVVFMADGRKVEEGPPAQLFDSPVEARTNEFVSKILRH